MPGKRYFMYETDCHKSLSETQLHVKWGTRWVFYGSIVQNGLIVRLQLPLGQKLRVSHASGNQYFYIGNGGLKRIKKENA